MRLLVLVRHTQCCGLSPLPCSGGGLLPSGPPLFVPVPPCVPGVLFVQPHRLFVQFASASHNPEVAFGGECQTKGQRGVQSADWALSAALEASRGLRCRQIPRPVPPEPVSCRVSSRAR